MTRRCIGVLVAFTALTLSARAAARDWWVDQAAAAGGDGTEAAPFQRLNDVAAVLQTGDTVWIAGGTYQETVDFWHVPAASGGRTTLRALPGANPVIDGGGTGGFVLQAGETPDMTFQGLTVRNGGTGIEFYQADGGQVVGCTIEASGAAVDFHFSSRGSVQGSKLQGSVAGKASDGTVIEDNEIYGSSAEGITLHADSKNCRYSRNVVHDNTSVNIYLDSISRTLVDSNLVYMTQPAAADTVGIMLADESYDNVTAPVLGDIVISNNVLVDNESGIRFWDGNFPGQSALKRVSILNNTVLDSATTSIKWDAGPHENTVVTNNIFAGQSGRQLLLLQANSPGGVSLEHNVWYLPGVVAPFLWDGATYDHAGLVAATGQGTGDVLADPTLVGAWSLPVSNLELAPGSPAIDQGAGVAVDHDFRGAARPAGSGYDLGAFEYGAAIPNGGAGGTGGGAMAGGGAGGQPASTGEAEGGCGCRVGPKSCPTGSRWVAHLALLAMLARRRRGRSPA